MASKALPFESHILELGGHRIHYIDEGSGPTLLLIHAGPAWSFVYRDLIARMRNEFRCIALDFPASGSSQAAAGYRPSIEAASLVFEAFVKALDLRQVTLVVHDVGSPVALYTAAKMPDRFIAFAVMEAFGWSLRDENPKIARALRIVGSRPFGAIDAVTNLLARVTASPGGVGRHFTAEDRAAFLAPYRDRTIRRTARVMLGDAAQANEYLRRFDRDLRTALPDRPTLLIFGTDSPTVKAGFPEQWKERLPQSQLLMVKGAHHFPIADEPDVVAEAIRTWWRESVRIRMAPAQKA